MTDIPIPPHAYVPGQTTRHPEGWFDALKTPDIAMDAGLRYFEQGFFWECHEVLEAVWLDQPDPSPERDMVQAIIQLANARLKLRMNRPKAALRLCGIVRDLLNQVPSGASPLGQSKKGWQAELSSTMAALVP